jgi:hypothetical protein
MRSESALIGSVPPAKLSPRIIVSEDAALRGMRESDVRSNGRIKKSAFKPRSNGEDRDGLSVSISDPAYIDVHRAKYEQPKRATAIIVVREILKIGLGVVADPYDMDPRHALITGIADLTQGEAEKLEAERTAELLANQASIYRFPSRDS